MQEIHHYIQDDKAMPNEVRIGRVIDQLDENWYRSIQTEAKTASLPQLSTVLMYNL
jgi:hypothetical protein